MPSGRRRLWIAAGLTALAVFLGLALMKGGREEIAAVHPASDPATAVRAAAAERGNLEIHAEYPGELVGEAVDLAPRIAGRLVGVSVRVGERVAARQVVARIDDSDLRRQHEEARAEIAAAEANLNRAAAQLVEAESELSRAGGLVEADLISAQEFDRISARAGTARAERGASEARVAQARARAELLQQQLADTRIVAPFAGTVSARYLDPGAMAQPATPVVRLVRGDPLRVQFRIPERDVAEVSPGDLLTVSTQATGEHRFHGRVTRLAGEVSRSDRTVLVEGIVEERGEVLRPGMYAQVRVRLSELAGATLVPGLAVLTRVRPDGVEQTGVFTLEPDGRARWSPVVVQGRDQGRVAIAGEVAPGEMVLTMGHEELGEGSPVMVVGDGS